MSIHYTQDLLMTDDSAAPIPLLFEEGSIVASRQHHQLSSFACFETDARTDQFRAKGMDYKELILALRERHLNYTDLIKNYQILSLTPKKHLQLRPYQKASLDQWIAHEKRGVIALPTGAGKTIVAVAAILEVKRSTLVVVPTIDLLYQWRDVLETYFDTPIGILGDGQREAQSITVSTYDSARLTIDRLGNHFGLIIFDECHHLPSPQYQYIAQCAIAPYRLGLSATVERTDGKESLIYELLGPLVYEGKISDLVANSLAPYDVVSLEVELTDEERVRYKQARDIYIRFVQKNRIDFSQKDAWKRFLFLSSRSKEGREAFLAQREQKLLAQRAKRKMDQVWDLLTHHSQEQMILFTDDNETAYRIGCAFFLPVITHKTKDRDRKRFLESFKKGEIKVLVTSRVLNEGVDVPEASIGVVVSGSGTVREHVQRLGRILRPRPGKRALLYEIVARATNEVHVNQRRRRHDAYEGSSES
jgi:superfamily II DNA or RNA helicase